MKRYIKSALALLLVVVIVLSVSVSALAAGQPSSYSTTTNSGTRNVACTTLSGTRASGYYTGQYTYERLSTLSSSSLLTTLRTLMTSTHSYKSSYNDCKNYADKMDCENNSGKMTSLYTSYVTNYNSGGINREHVWPKSLGGFETSGPGADLHHIRPTESTPNSNRGNLKYGNVSGGSTSYGNVSGKVGGTYGSYFEPLDNVKGDVARICLYVYVRYGGEYSKCSSITNVFQSVDVLLEWCEMDPVDTWEMGRNEVVYAKQGNRNVFIDYPELAWQLYGRQVPAGMTTPSGNASGSVTPPVDTPDTPAACTHSSTEIRNRVSATCGTAGYTGDKYCSSCGEKLESGSTIAATGNHTWGEPVVVTPPTETAYGTEKSTCSVCSATKTTNIPPTGSATPDTPAACTHSSTEIRDKVSATCGTDGYTGDKYCSSCGEKLETGSTISATGNHVWGEPVVVNPPSETAFGTEKSTCVVCSATKTTHIPPTGSSTPDEPLPDDDIELPDNPPVIPDEGQPEDTPTEPEVDEITELLGSISSDEDRMIVMINLGVLNGLYYDLVADVVKK